MNGASDQDGDLALGALIATLRGAVPSERELAGARAGLARAVARGPHGWRARGAKLLVLALFVAAGASGALAPSRAHDGTGSAADERTPGGVASRKAPRQRAPLEGMRAAEPRRPPPGPETEDGARPPARPRRAHAARRTAPVAPVAAEVVALGAKQPFESPPSGASAPIEPLPPPPSETLAQATRAFATEQCETAAPALVRVVQGDTSDTSDRVERAQWMLGICLVRLGFPNAALGVFDEITRAGAGHARWDATLPWLGRLARILPEPAGVGEAAARYPVARIEPLAVDREGRAERDALLYAIGKRAWDEHDPALAARLLARVTTSSRFYVPAKIVEGVAWVRLRRAVPARAAFEAALLSLSRGDSSELGRADRDRLRDVAWLSIARLDYAAAFRQERDGSTSVDPALITEAIGAWRRVQPGSEAWLDSTFEQSWADFMAEDDGASLGRLHALLAPQFEGAFFPEAYALRSTVLFRNCRYGEARTEVRRFHERYDSVAREVDALVRARGEDHAAWWRLAIDVIGRRAAPRQGVGAALHAALSDRALVKHVDWIRSLDAELARVDALGPAVAAGPLGERIRQDVTLARSFGVDRAGAIVRERVERVAEELRERTNDVDTVDLEITTLERTSGPLRAPSQQIEIWAEQGDEPWPFDGEYWEDELPYFRARNVAACRR